MIQALTHLFGTSRPKLIRALKAMKATLEKRNSFNDAVFLCQYLGHCTDLADQVRLIIRRYRQKKVKKHPKQSAEAPAQYLLNEQ